MSQPFTASARCLASLCSAGALCVAVASCSAPPEHYEGYAPPPPTRWISIDGSDVGVLETRCASIHLEGLAYSSEGEATVSWRNLTTGATGNAFHEPVQSNDESWWADVPLALGPNALVVIMVDRLDVPTQGSTIAERLPGVAISGRVESTPGSPLGGIRVTADGPVSVSATSDRDGRYAIGCLADGTYTLHVSSTCHATLPGEREVVLSGADLNGQDFQVGSISHAIWGRVSGPWALGIPGVTVEATDLLSGWTVRTVTPGSTGLGWWDGFYELCVPPASFRVRPSRWEMDEYEPPEATVTITNADVRQDFRLK